MSIGGWGVVFVGKRVMSVDGRSDASIGRQGSCPSKGGVPRPLVGRLSCSLTGEATCRSMDEVSCPSVGGVLCPSRARRVRSLNETT
jgi:hypothetical protein